MDLNSELLILIEELDRTHGAPFSLSDSAILDFVTTKAGRRDVVRVCF
ncbi:hypothetical protein [Sphingomonas sp. PP-CC-3G-468]|nr:hypothetical protein [Sphingomonas sp. PP-CC-3G-468]TCM07356.1 hypothetical protein C8J41_103264 [Sphingomonas sp. PP-CC-3G-468]